MIHDALDESGYLDRLPAGVVLTGGGSQLQGFSELGRQVLNMPVRSGSPLPDVPITGLARRLQSPSHATSVGLLLWGLHEDARQVKRRYPPKVGNAVESVRLNQAVRWLRNLLPD